MSMNQNDDIRYLDIGLPEDIARLTDSCREYRSR